MLETASKVYSNLAAIYLSRKQWGTTIGYCKESITAWSGNARAYYRLAEANLLKGNCKRALGAIDTGLAHPTAGPQLKKDPRVADARERAMAGLAKQEAREAAIKKAEDEEEAAVEAARGAAKERNLRVAPPLWRGIVRTGARPRVETQRGLKVLVTPVVLLYPVSGQSDLIEAMPEMDTLGAHLSQCLPASQASAQAATEGASSSSAAAAATAAGSSASSSSSSPEAQAQEGFLPWDSERKYTLDNVDVYYQANSAKPMPLSLAWRKESDPLHNDAKPEPIWAGQSWVNVPLEVPLLLALVQPDCVLTDVPVFYVVARGTAMHAKVQAEAGGKIRTLSMPRPGGAGGVGV